MHRPSLPSENLVARAVRTLSHRTARPTDDARRVFNEHLEAKSKPAFAADHKAREFPDAAVGPLPPSHVPSCTSMVTGISREALQQPR